MTFTSRENEEPNAENGEAEGTPDTENGTQGEPNAPLTPEDIPTVTPGADANE